MPLKRMEKAGLHVSRPVGIGRVAYCWIQNDVRNRMVLEIYTSIINLPSHLLLSDLNSRRNCIALLVR